MVITLIEHNILWNNAEGNRQMIANSLANIPQSDIIVLPETFTTGFGGNMKDVAEEPEGLTLQWARQQASLYDSLFVATWIVKQNGAYYNRLHWIFPDGTYGYYDKAHLFRISTEAQQLTRGHTRTTFLWRGWRIQPAICYDLRFPTWLRNTVNPQTKQLDYDLLLLCANWPSSRRTAWSTLLSARAIENIAYVAACNRIGSDPMQTHYSGNSTILDFKGTPIGKNIKNNIISAELDLASLHHFRQHWPFYLDFDPQQ